MKHKIVATVQDIHDNVDQYLNYSTRLAKDFGYDLELIAGSPIIQTTQTPTALVGVGKLHPAQLLQMKTLDERKSVLDQRVGSLKKLYNKVDYNIGIGPIENRMYDDDLRKESVLCIVNQKSKDNFFNQVFGTIETNISKNTSLPTLIIPDGYEYKKPKKVLIIIRNTPDIDNQDIQEYVSNFNLEATYAFQEEKQEILIKDMMESLGKKFTDFRGEVKSFTLANNGADLDKLVEECQPDWIGIKNYNRSVIERLYDISTNSLALSSQLPITIF